jgi:3-methyladenine DNA glycosylase AlkD
MKAEEYFTPLIKSLSQAKDPVRALSQKKYMRNQFAFFGLKHKPRQDICKAFLKQAGLPAYSDLEPYLHYLWELPQRDFQHFAMELATKLFKQMDKGFIHLIEFMLTHKSWWDTVDYIAAWHAGKYFQNYPEEILPITEKWMVSGNFWLQRSALLFQLKYKKNTDFDLLTSYILRLKDEKEFFIRKAIGWTLREYSKTNADKVKVFVAKTDISNLSKTEALKWLKRRETSDNV